MSSLQEQLLKAGLVDEKKLAKAEHEKNKRAKAVRKKHGKKAAQSKQPARPQAQNKKAQRDRELNQKRQQEAQRRERAAQAKQLIDGNKQDRSKGEIPYGFAYRGKVKKIHVTEAQRDQLVAGKLGIVTWVANNEGRRFELVPKDVAEKIRARDEASFVVLGQPAQPEPDATDPYADYQVPDDLIW